MWFMNNSSLFFFFIIFCSFRFYDFTHTLSLRETEVSTRNSPMAVFFAIAILCSSPSALCAQPSTEWRISAGTLILPPDPELHDEEGVRIAIQMTIEEDMNINII